MKGKSLWRVGILVLALILVGNIGSCGALTPQEQLERAMEYVGSANYGAAVDVLEDILLDLREKAPLKIQNVDLATEVHQFGMYDKRESSIFAPDEPILIYSEVRNFTSEKIAERLWSIRLSMDVQIFDVDDNLMAEMKDFLTIEINPNTARLQDLMFYPTISPEGWPAGDYKVRVIVTDVPSAKKADLVVAITIKEEGG